MPALPQAAAAAWRKKAALQWHLLRGAQPPEEQQRQLPALLQQLQDAQGIAMMARKLAPEAPLLPPAPPPPPAQQQAGTPVLAHRLHQFGASAPAAQPTPAARDAPSTGLHTPAAGAAAGAYAGAGGGSLVDQYARLQQAAAGLPADAAAHSGGGTVGTAAAVADIQQQLHELRQLLAAQQQAQQGAQQQHQQQLHQHPLGLAASSHWEAESHHGTHGRRALYEEAHGWAPLPPGRQQELGPNWAAPYEARAPGDWQLAPPPTAPLHGSSGGGGCTVRLPGDPPLPAALRILSATIRRAVPASERASAAKRAALVALLRCGLDSCARDTFQQRPVGLRELADELERQVRKQVCLVFSCCRAAGEHSLAGKLWCDLRLPAAPPASPAPRLLWPQGGPRGREVEEEAARYPSLLDLLLDVSDDRLLGLPSSGQQRQQQHQVLLRVDHLAAAYGQPSDLAAAAAGGAGPSSRHEPPPLGEHPAAGAYGLTHLAPAWLGGTHWELTTAECQCSMPCGREQQLLAELEDLCASVGASGRLQLLPQSATEPWRACPEPTAHDAAPLGVLEMRRLRLRPLCCAVVSSRIKDWGEGGNVVVYLVCASAQQAALAMERLNGVRVGACTPAVPGQLHAAALPQPQAVAGGACIAH